MVTAEEALEALQRARAYAQEHPEDEAASTAMYEAEEVEERARAAAQLARADLTPYPAADDWRIEVTWLTPTGGWWGGGHVELTVVSSAGREEALNTGQRFACLRGAARVRVADPAGAIVASWDREGRYWQEHDRG